MEKLLTRKLEHCGKLPSYLQYTSLPSIRSSKRLADLILLLYLIRCPERVLNELFASLSVLSVELVPIHQRLVQMRRQLSSLAALEKPPKAEVKALMEELRKIDR
jgi:hypothetical protein